MTRPKDDRSPEERVQDLLGDAFEERGELIPSTEASVRRAEEQGAEQGELPASLRELRPRLETERRVVSLAEERQRRSPWLTHALAAAIGAAAAAALLLTKREKVEPGGQFPTSEPAPPRADAAPAPEPVTLPDVQACGAGCCAGERCKSAKPELASCSSGRRCVACSSDELAASRYRLRLGAFAPTEAGVKAVNAAGALELCVRVGSSEPACVPAQANTNATEQWSLLPMLASAQDLLAGLVLEVRPKAAGQKAIGEWRSPVQINPTTLCRGLSLKAKTPKDEALGVVSVFLDDAHWVELRRAGGVADLLAHRKRFVLGNVSARLFETRGAGDARFALVLGPVDKPTAERLRWSLLEKGEEARLTVGEDHLGEPKPVE